MTVFNRDKIITLEIPRYASRRLSHGKIKIRHEGFHRWTVIVEAIMFLASFRRVYKVAKLRSLRGTDER